MMALHGRQRTERPELSSTLSDESVRLGLVDQPEVMRTMQSLADVWEEEAEAEARAQAKVAARLAAERTRMLRSVVLRMAERRFGKLPPEVTTARDSVADEETLNVVLDRPTDVGTVGERRALWPGAGTPATG